jgi:transposase InsO family protein
MEQRKEFLEAAVRGEHSFTELCRRYGISRKNGYKWLNRHLIELAVPGGKTSFADRSRRPHNSPTAISAEVEAAIVELRKQRPHWGPKKLRVVLAKQNPDVAWPSESTFAAVLKRNGLVKPRRKRTKSTPYTAPLGHAQKPNAVWAIDFKGDFAIGRARCYPLTITDSYSRFIIACVALTNTKTNAVKRAVQRVFDEYGLPEAIRSDNGSPFSSRGVAGLSTLSVWWHKLGIRHERIDPGHPEQNGRHERMHRDLKRETASPPATTMAKQQRLFDQFRARFNQERPHEALEQRTPDEFYEVSSRRLPQRWWGKDFEYDMEAEALRVSKDGYIATHRGAFFLSTTLAHELVEVDWYESNRARVLFGALNLGELVAKAKRRQLRFFPVESVNLNQPTAITAERPRKPSPMSLDNAPF